MDLYNFDLKVTVRNIFEIDDDLEFIYDPIKWPQSNEKEATGPVLKSFKGLFDSFLKKNDSSIEQLGVHFKNTQCYLNAAKSNIPIDEFNGITYGNIDGVIVPIEKQSGGKEIINPEIMTTCLCIIQLKKPYKSKGKNCRCLIMFLHKLFEK